MTVSVQGIQTSAWGGSKLKRDGWVCTERGDLYLLRGEEGTHSALPVRSENQKTLNHGNSADQDGCSLNEALWSCDSESDKGTPASLHRVLELRALRVGLQPYLNTHEGLTVLGKDTRKAGRRAQSSSLVYRLRGVNDLPGQFSILVLMQYLQFREQNRLLF